MTVPPELESALLELVRHKTWATLGLIEHCRGLPDEHLDASIAGTFGTIRDTLRHLVDSDEGYYQDLTGERLWEELPEEGPVPLDELARRIRELAPRWEGLARAADIQGREIVTKDDGWDVPGGVPLAQAIHHADDHRTHVLTVLGARGLEVPSFSVWRHAIATGTMTRRSASS